MLTEAVVTQRKKTETGADPVRKKHAVMKVAKDIVADAKKTAALGGVKIREVVEPLLLQCHRLIQREFADETVQVVADRANALTHLEKEENLGPLSVDPAVSEDLVRDAGYARSSIAKLVDAHLRVLVGRELKKAMRRQANSAKVWHDDPGFSLPLFEDIPPQPPNTSETDATSFDVATRLGGDGTYMVKVRGSGLEDQHIMDGDMIVIRKPPVEPGQTVVAVVGRSMTVKKLRRERLRKSETIKEWLDPVATDSDVKPIPVGQDVAVNVLGQLVGVFRWFR